MLRKEPREIRNIRQKGITKYLIRSLLERRPMTMPLSCGMLLCILNHLLYVTFKHIWSKDMCVVLVLG